MTVPHPNANPSDVYRKLAVLVLVLAICPAASELLEVGIHLAAYGDLGHAGGDDHGETSPNEEHGCSELFHMCGCHAHITPLLQQASVFAWDAYPRSFAVSFRVDSDTGLDDPEPPLRPPASAFA